MRVSYIYNSISEIYVSYPYVSVSYSNELNFELYYFIIYLKDSRDLVFVFGRKNIPYFNTFIT